MTSLLGPVGSHFISYIGLPILVAFTLRLLLPVYKGQRNRIFWLILGSAIVLFMVPLLLCPPERLNSYTDWLVSILSSTAVVIIVSIFLEKHVVSSWLGSSDIFRLFWIPKKASHIRKVVSNRQPFIMLSLCILLFTDGIPLSALVLLVHIFFSLEYTFLLYLFSPLFILGYLHFGIFRLFVNCEHCGRHVFDLKEYEFYQAARNIIFNKYFVCMHCHARFSMKEGIDLENLPNNYQKDYDQDPPKRWW